MVYHFIDVGSNLELEAPYLVKEKYEEFQKMVESEQVEDIIKLIEDEEIFEKLNEDINLCKILKVSTREIRKVLKHTGIIGIKEYQISEGGENMKLTKH